jgi:hypothetical protein
MLGDKSYIKKVSKRKVEWWHDDACVQAEAAVHSLQATPEQQERRQKWCGHDDFIDQDANSGALCLGRSCRP